MNLRSGIQLTDNDEITKLLKENNDINRAINVDLWFVVIILIFIAYQLYQIKGLL